MADADGFGALTCPDPSRKCCETSGGKPPAINVHKTILVFWGQ